MKNIRFTREGYEKLKKEQEVLLKSRPEAVQDLKKARDMGDLSENGYYKAAKSKLVSIDRNLRRTEYFLKQAVITTNKKITVSDGKETIVYELVGDLEAEPLQGKISVLSPIGKALQGTKEGETAIIKIPRGTITYKVIKVV